MAFTKFVLTLLTFAAAITAAPHPTKVDEIADLFGSSLNHSFAVPKSCKAVTTLAGNYLCQVQTEPLYMNWREAKQAATELRAEFAGRLSINSWTVENQLIALKEDAQADYWTIEYGDRCLQKSTKTSGKLCLVVKVLNAWE
jgi:hypothetical protein